MLRCRISPRGSVVDDVQSEYRIFRRIHFFFLFRVPVFAVKLITNTPHAYDLIFYIAVGSAPVTYRNRCYDLCVYIYVTATWFIFHFILFFLPSCRYWILYVYREPRRNLPKSITAVKLRFAVVKYPDRMIYERVLAGRWALQSLPTSKLVFDLMTFFASDPRQLFRPHTSGPKIAFAEFVFYNRKQGAADKSYR